jgi:tetratricopeptide (TPR) repeat protein
VNVLLAALLAAAAAEDKSPVLVLPPAGAAAQGHTLPLLAQERATALVAGKGRLPYFHLKQAAAVAASEGWDLYAVNDVKVARAFGDALGATHVAFGTLSTDPKGNAVLEVQVSSAGKPAVPAKKVTLPRGLAAQAEAAAVALAGALETVTGKKPDFKPEASTVKDAALEDFARCLEAVAEQPIGVENPAVLDEAVLNRAIAAGESAVAGGAGDGARAALGLAQAIAGFDEKAVATLGPIPMGPKAPTLAWVGRFWLVTRYKSDDEGLAVLREALKQNPNDLLLRGYVGELLQVLNRHEEAINAFADLSRLAPKDPFAQVRAAKSIARQGKHDEAVAKTQGALALSPNSRALRMQLGSRFIDAAKWDDAATVLALLTSEAPTGDHYVRLGYALLHKGDIAKAEEALKKALAVATGPRDWRVRARANEDLALLAVKRGVRGHAMEYLVAAQKEGYRPRQFAPELQALAKDMEKKALLGNKDAGTTASLTPRLKDASPFTVASDGDIDLTAPRPKAFAGLDILKADPRGPFNAPGTKQ